MMARREDDRWRGDDDGVTDPMIFLLAYEEAILGAGGDDQVMANWLPMALTGISRAWLLRLPTASVTS